MAGINGGYFIISRKIQNSPIMRKPPNYWKVWTYLISKASYQDHGNLKRGQGFVSIPELIDFCTYYIGARPHRPTKKEIWNILEWLRNPHEGNNEGQTKEPMVVTARVTHGMIYTICKYGLYQDSSTYEGNGEGNDEIQNEKQRRGEEGNNINKKGHKKGHKNTSVSPKPVPYEAIRDLWNNTVVDLPRVSEMTDNRRRTVRARFSKCGLDGFAEMFERVNQSDFLCGRVERSNFRAGFDWVLRPANWIKIQEGNYDNNKKGENNGLLPLLDD